MKRAIKSGPSSHPIPQRDVRSNVDMVCGTWSRNLPTTFVWIWGTQRSAGFHTSDLAWRRGISASRKRRKRPSLFRCNVSLLGDVDFDAANCPCPTVRDRPRVDHSRDGSNRQPSSCAATHRIISILHLEKNSTFWKQGRLLLVCLVGEIVKRQQGPRPMTCQLSSSNHGRGHCSRGVPNQSPNGPRNRGPMETAVVPNSGGGNHACLLIW